MPPRRLDEQFVIGDPPAAFIGRLAGVLGEFGYTLRSQTDETAVFNREETKWVGIAFGGTKKTVKTIVVQLSAPNADGWRTVRVDGDDPRLADLFAKMRKTPNAASD